MCIRDSRVAARRHDVIGVRITDAREETLPDIGLLPVEDAAVSYTHLRAHETVLDLVCRLLLEKKKTDNLSTVSMSYLTNIPVSVRHLHNHPLTGMHTLTHRTTAR